MSSLPDGGRYRKARALPLSRMARDQKEIPEVFRKWEQKARTSKEEWKWQRGILSILSMKAKGTDGISV